MHAGKNFLGQKSRAKQGKSKSLWDEKLFRQALIDALGQTQPRTMMRNPVMFVVEVGSVITTVLLMRTS